MPPSKKKQGMTEEELRAEHEKLVCAKIQAAEAKLAALVEELESDGLVVRITHQIQIAPRPRG